MGNDHSGAIWVLGLFLVIAVSVTSPYWQNVGRSAFTGQPPNFQAAGPGGLGNGPWVTLGAFLLVVILAGLAEISPGMGGVALMLLIGLWVLFLLGHVSGIGGIFSFLSQKGAG